MRRAGSPEGAAPPRLMLVADSLSYNLEAFERAARAAGAEVVAATDRCHVLAAEWADALGERVLPLHLRAPGEAVAQILEYARARPLAAILSLSDRTTEVAARAAAALGLPHNPEGAARAARSKIAMREALARGRVAQPRFQVFDFDEVPERAAAAMRFPCVLKPALLSASRGVLRADDRNEAARAFRRIRALLGAPELLADGDPDARKILVEQYVPGVEVALEGILASSRLQVLAVFDKPDPLEGPTFEETLYVTPSRLPAGQLERVAAQVQAATRALGLALGPVHAEVRLDADEAWVIEVAARPIGGLCGSALRFDAGMGLEELVVLHSLGQAPPAARRESAASGVMMLPVPRAGVLREVRGVAEVMASPLIEDLKVTARPGDELVPLPEGSSYLGFLFARGPTPEAVEAALRSAHRRLSFDIVPRLHEAR